MAQDRLEECLQAVARREKPGTVERGRESVNSVDLTPEKWHLTSKRSAF
jgi:hypothetical protein